MCKVAATKTLRITLNGDPFTVEDPATIAGLLAMLDIDPRRVAVERNFVIVKRDQYAATEITDGEQIEVVNFVGGGSARLRLSRESAGG